MHPGSQIEAVFLCREPVDLRKSIDGLAGIVQHAFGANPFAASVHVFVNARRDIAHVRQSSLLQSSTQYSSSGTCRILRDCRPRPSCRIV
jgi:hypothetical protein